MPHRVERLLTPFQKFVRSESFGGLLLIATAALAFAWANSPWAASYEAMKAAPVGLRFGGWGLEKALVLWVNDLLMAIFFLLVGLEIKRELVTGELSDPAARRLPVAAALGGMVVPALVYLGFHGGVGTNGWGIPMATDIAFALGLLALLGSRVPLALKVFLTAVAIVDDLGAVLVIALFYSGNLDLTALAAAGVTLGVTFGYKFAGGRRLGVFYALGLVLWYFTLKSGIHATIAGVLLAFAIPMRRLIEPESLHLHLDKMFQRDGVDMKESELEHLEALVNQAQSPLHECEHSIHPWVAYGVMPLFALFNAGFALGEGASLLAPVSLAAFVGLVVGKPIGIAGAAWIATKFAGASLPRGVGWSAILGVSFLAGIGFTMSLFIAALAFQGEPALIEQAKLGVLAASIVAAILGLGVLWRTLPKAATPES